MAIVLTWDVGFAMSYGVFQEYYYENWTLQGSRAQTGIIGTTQNGVMYLSMPFLFALFTKRWARWRQIAALCGAVVGGESLDGNFPFQIDLQVSLIESQISDADSKSLSSSLHASVSYCLLSAPTSGI